MHIGFSVKDTSQVAKILIINLGLT